MTEVVGSKVEKPKREKVTVGWKFVKGSMRSAHGRTLWNLGEWQEIRGQLVMCEHGFHAAPTVLDSFRWVWGTRLFKVEAKGNIVRSGDKFVASQMRLVREVDIHRFIKDAILRVVSLARRKFSGNDKLFRFLRKLIELRYYPSVGNSYHDNDFISAFLTEVLGSNISYFSTRVFEIVNCLEATRHRKQISSDCQRLFGLLEKALNDVCGKRDSSLKNSLLSSAASKSFVDEEEKRKRGAREKTEKEAEDESEDDVEDDSDDDWDEEDEDDEEESD
jgi:hypothetical protein